MYSFNLKYNLTFATILLNQTAWFFMKTNLTKQLDPLWKLTEHNNLNPPGNYFNIKTNLTKERDPLWKLT